MHRPDVGGPFVLRQNVEHAAVHDRVDQVRGQIRGEDVVDTEFNRQPGRLRGRFCLLDRAW